MKLNGEAAIVGFVELPPQRKTDRPPMFTVDQYAALAKAALEDAGIPATAVNGLITAGLRESDKFAPATLSEYLGLPLNYGEVVDLGGANSAAMVWRAAVAVELGLCDAVLAVVPGHYEFPRSSRRPAPEPDYFGASSNTYGSPQAEFEIPYGNLGQNAPYAQIAQRYAMEYGYDPRATAKIAVDQRANACATPEAVFHGKPITIEDVLASPIIADPLHMLEMVMRCRRRCRGGRRERRPRPLSASPPGLGRRVRGADRVQDADLRRGSAAFADG